MSDENQLRLDMKRAAKAIELLKESEVLITEHLDAFFFEVLHLIHRHIVHQTVHTGVENRDLFTHRHWRVLILLQNFGETRATIELS